MSRCKKVIDAPCLGCDDRYLGCHDRCENYKAYKEKSMEINQRKQEERGAGVFLAGEYMTRKTAAKKKGLR